MASGVLASWPRYVRRFIRSSASLPRPLARRLTGRCVPAAFLRRWWHGAETRAPWVAPHREGKDAPVLSAATKEVDGKRQARHVFRLIRRWWSSCGVESSPRCGQMACDFPMLVTYIACA